MQKKTIIIISFISAILSLIYVLLNYYGFIRYMGLYMFPVEGYSKNYKNLDKIGKDRTIISLTATPEQMKKLSTVIKSLLDQTVRVDLISVTVPYGDKYKLPKELEGTVSLFRCGKNRSLLNCLSPVVSRENESTTKIITVGTDTIYGKDFIETLLEESEKNPDAIIYSSGDAKDNIDISKGVVFCTKLFNKDFIDEGDIGGNEWVNTYFKDTPRKWVNYNENYKRV